jgi:hypothetical protein
LGKDQIRTEGIEAIRLYIVAKSNEYNNEVRNEHPNISECF